MREKPLRDLLEELDIKIIGKNHRDWVVCSCPFSPYLHERGTDRRPSFFVKVEDNGLSAFKCWTCHQHGNMRSLVSKLEYHRGEDYNRLLMRAFLDETPDTFASYEDRIAMQAPPEPLEETTIVGMFPLAWEDKAARAYLTSRGITAAASYVMELAFDPEQLRILFPVRGGSGELYGWAGRSILSADALERHHHPKVRNYAGLRSEYRLLGEHLAQKGKPMFVVEGLFAYAHLVSIGARDLCNPVATFGSNLTVQQRDLLASHAAPVFMCYDLDAAGELGLYGNPKDPSVPGALKMLKEHVPTMVALYPQGVDDVDDFTLDHVARILEKDFDFA